MRSPRFKSSAQSQSAVRRDRPLAEDDLVHAPGWHLDVPGQPVLTDAANGKTSTLGFCWGGAQSFSYAVSQPELDAAVVFYGSSPETADLAKIKAPVLGLYGSDNARVNVTVPPAEAEMRRLGKTFETHTFEGAGHGFTRSQEAREANFKAVQQAWPKVLAFLRNDLK